MNLNDFERHFDRGVLERGRPYYEDGSVTSLELQDGAWLASVEGTYDYEVSVVLSDKGEIMETSCDCPFDMDRYCKHQAAVLYALRDRLAAGKGKKKEGKKESIRGVLEKQDKESLISIIMDIAGKDKGVKEGILLRYSEKGDITGYARGVVQGAIAAAETDGYVRYGDGRKAVKGAKSVLKMAADKVGSGDAESAVSLCIVVLDELIRLVSHCDDSDGCIGGVASDAWTTIEEALSLRPPQDYGGGVFDAILEHALGPVHDSWGDWRDNLLFILVPLCAVRANRDKMETYLSSR
ncbi:MAG: SWIM zinc finger family protein, partial [Methanomassiliicoccaceae archaeon]|nr:SWIM zinc finger family protein [Methanomassiliicoccaceae archaeon]